MLVSEASGNEDHLKRGGGGGVGDYYLSYVITNFEYGGLPVDLFVVAFIFTV